MRTAAAALSRPAIFDSHRTTGRLLRPRLLLRGLPARLDDLLALAPALHGLAAGLVAAGAAAGPAATTASLVTPYGCYYPNYYYYHYCCYYYYYYYYYYYALPAGRSSLGCEPLQR